MILPLWIAFKFHQSFKRNILISLVSIISIISITIGIATSIIALSIMHGFEYELSNRILSIIPHGNITSIKIPFVHWKSVLSCVKKIPDVIHVNPYISFSGIIEYRNKRHFVHIKSIDLIENKSINSNKLTCFIEKKSWKWFCEHKNQIILGKGASTALQIQEGDWITILIAHDCNKENNFFSPKKIQVQVSGILNLRSQLDDNIAIISLLDAQNYSNRLDIDGIEISVNNVFYVDHIIYKIKEKLHNSIQITSWMNTYGYIYHDIQIIRMTIYLSIIFIIGISCFNIIAVLLLSIKNKNLDIVILRSLGVKTILIQHIFLWYGLIIYCISGCIGTCVGIFLSLNIENINMQYFNIFNKTIFPEKIYFIDFIPSKLHICDIFSILIIILFLGLLISWYSSKKTKKIILGSLLK